MDAVKIPKWEFQRKNLCTHITALKAFRNLVFVAEGNQILCFDWRERKLLQKEIIFQSCSIHGIRIGCNYKILFYGAKSVRIYEFNSSEVNRFREISKEFYLDDWIHDVQWLAEDSKKDQFIVISAHNCATFYSSNIIRIKTCQSSENCILYSASIISQDGGLIVIAAGTVFKKILLWSPNFFDENNGRKLPFQSLSNHQGVIFSIMYNKFQKLICSTSDDRSVRLWKIQNDAGFNENTADFWVKSVIQCVHVLYAHSSRVWMAAILNNCILSVGEDSHICFWSLEGELLKKKKCHKGGSIWCLETASFPSDNNRKENEKYIAFTGGSDGGVYMWNITDNSSAEKISQISFPSSESLKTSDFPRIISLLSNNLMDNLIVTTDKGFLSVYNMREHCWKNIFSDYSFASYCVPSISNGSIYLALGNIYGDLVLLKLSETQFEKGNFQKFKIHESKICSIHWVNPTSDYLLTCSIKGHMTFWKINYQNNEFSIQSIRKLYLQKCKNQWWSTAAVYIANEDCIVVGDRSGTISLYSHIHEYSDNQVIYPFMTHRYIHGENGVTDIQENESLIYSTGRDGRVQVYHVCDGHLNLMHCIKVSHDLEWIGRMLFIENDLLLLGFHTKDFVVWSTKLESALMTVECGGGHRSWDFYLAEDGQATFAAIKKKDVIFCRENLHHALKQSILKTGITGQEFCQATYLYSKSYNSKGDSMAVIACGGEDNALRIIGILDKLCHGSEIVSICSFSGHLSSIRSINKIAIAEKNAYLLVSVGGRSQMMIWKLVDDSNIKCWQLASYILSDLDKSVKSSKKNIGIQMDPQTRLMDVSVCYSTMSVESSDEYLISVACSDSYFRIYLFDLKQCNLILCYKLHHGQNCILKLSEILVKDRCINHIFMATGSTDGCIKIFNSEICKTFSNSTNENNTSGTIIPLVQMKLHQSGVNALDAKPVSETTWLICSGGDDNSLSVVLVNFLACPIEKMKLEVICKSHVPYAHASQITGVKILEQSAIITVSIDQRVNIWSWNFKNNSLIVELETFIVSLIPDIAHLEVWQDNTSEFWNIFVCGQGIEVFKLDSCKFIKSENAKRMIL